MKITFYFTVVSIASFARSHFDPTTHPNWHLVNDESCGLQPSLRIIGGKNAHLGEFPWVVYVLSDKTHIETGETQNYQCGGSIISQKHVLSAAHCFAEQLHTTSNIRFMVGEYDLSTDPDCNKDFCAPNVMQHHALRVFIHPEFIPPNGMEYDPHADIAVIRVDPEFIFNDFVAPICLEFGDLLNRDHSGEMSVTIGWGIWDVVHRTIPHILQKVSLEVVDESTCTEVLSASVPSSGRLEPEAQICAGTQTQFSYPGDSGSPMFVAESADYDIIRQYQIGIVISSFDPSETVWNGGKRPNTYTKVSHYLEWILDQMSELNY